MRPFAANNIRSRTRTITCLLAALTAPAVVLAAAPSIRLNTIGFLPDQPKQASIAAACSNFNLLRTKDGQVVFRGTVSGPRTNLDTKETLFTADFSKFHQTGRFQLDVPGVGSSATFRITPEVYDVAFKTVTRAMYLWRCGTAVSGVHQGKTFYHATCHTNDAWLDFVGGGHVRSNSVGGWHDAGDYNKYVVNAGVTVGCLFRAWEDFQPALKRVQLDLPETGGGLPDFLAELKWEIDWLLTMQADNGSVYHKVTTRSFGDFIQPEAETAERYFTPWSSAATADFVAMMAMAARNFQNYDPAFARQCLEAARKSHCFLVEHPENHRANLSGFTTGAYQSRDDDDRLWAAAELWATTGDTNCLAEFEKRAADCQPKLDSTFDWGNVKNLGMLTYLYSTRRGKDAGLIETIRASLVEQADEIVRQRDAHGYARPIGTVYFWGVNGTVARQVVLLQAANRIFPNSCYRDTALDALSYLFGRNPFGRSFVTGVGNHPPLHPHDRRSGTDDGGQPWPGYLVGGPNPRATDWKDEQVDYRSNEIAINWNAALIYALAGFLDAPPP